MQPRQPTTTNSKIEIILADDHKLFREGLKALLTNEKQLTITGLASNGDELIKIVEKRKPHIVITDIKMPFVDGIEATKEIKKKFPDIGVIALSLFDDEHYIVKMLEAGAKGYLLKTTDTTEIAYAVNKVYNKQVYYCSTSSNKIVDLFTRENTNSRDSKKDSLFSEMELKIIRLICQEYSSKEIADILQTNQRAVESARERIRDKIGCRNMAGVIIHAIRAHIFNLD